MHARGFPLLRVRAMSGRVGAAVLASLLLVGPAVGELAPAVPAFGLALAGVVLVWALVALWRAGVQ
jgi:hypothetical protein